MKIILNLLLIILIVATFSICAIKPDMHKTVFIFDSAYTVVPEKQVEIETQTIPVMEKKSEPVKTVKKFETPVKKETKTTKTENKKTAVKQPQTTAVKVQKIEQKTPTVTKVKQETKVEPKPQPIIKETQVVKQTPKTLTQREEEIAWNIWRSNLQNKIMQDVKLPIIPNGIVFKFSFTVDKFGKITNLKTWSTTSSYTPYAIQYIAPVIRSYQGKSILTFPQGTARTVTDVTGGWRISQNERYSTPQDYNDIEKIQRTNN